MIFTLWDIALPMDNNKKLAIPNGVSYVKLPKNKREY